MAPSFNLEKIFGRQGGSFASHPVAPGSIQGVTEKFHLDLSTA